MATTTRAMDAFADEWLSAWNRRDLDAILAHYTDDIVLQSPLAAKLLARSSGTVTGKDNLRAYFQRILDAFPDDFGAQLLGVYEGVESVIVHFQAKGGEGAEVMELSPERRVRRAIAHGRPA